MASENDSIHELLVQLKHGDNTDEAVAKLYARMFPHLCACGMMIGLSSDDAQDIAEDTLAHIFSPKIINDYVEPLRGGKTWIEKIFKNKVRDWRRKLSTRQKHETSFDERQEISLDDPNAHAFVSQHEEWQPEQYVLNKEQLKENEKKREILMRIREELTFREKYVIEVKGKGRGGRKGRAGSNEYRDAAERARTLYKKYLDLSETLKD